MRAGALGNTHGQTAAASAGWRLWRGIVALLALSSGAQAVQRTRRAADGWPGRRRAAPPPPTGRPELRLPTLNSPGPDCPMPYWRDASGRPPTCVLMMAWNTIDVAAERLDGVAARLGLALRPALGGAAAGLSDQVRGTALMLGQLRMDAARRASQYVTASWTTPPSGVPSRLAADMAEAASEGLDVLRGCEPAVTALSRHWLQHLAGHRAAADAFVLAPVVSQLERELEALEEQATAWAQADDAQASAPIEER